MSTLHHEEIYETCYDEAYDNFKVNNKLTNDQMEELLLHSGVKDAVIKQAHKLFEDKCY